jgi:hypothetical protein
MKQMGMRKQPLNTICIAKRCIKIMDSLMEGYQKTTCNKSVDNFPLA